MRLLLKGFLIVLVLMVLIYLAFVVLYVYASKEVPLRGAEYFTDQVYSKMFEELDAKKFSQFFNSEYELIGKNEKIAIFETKADLGAFFGNIKKEFGKLRSIEKFKCSYIEDLQKSQSYKCFTQGIFEKGNVVIDTNLILSQERFRITYIEIKKKTMQ